MKQTSNKSKKFRKGDKVVAIAGNDRGQTGDILSCVGDKVLVQGLNIKKRHVRKSEQNPQGGIIEIEKPIHISNLMLCVEEDKGVKLRVREDKSGVRELYYKDGKKEVAYRPVKKS